MAIVTASFDDQNEVVGIKIGSQGLNVTGRGVAARDFEITDNNKGIVLRSPNGDRYRLAVNSNGSVIAIKLN